MKRNRHDPSIVASQRRDAGVSGTVTLQQPQLRSLVAAASCKNVSGRVKSDGKNCAVMAMQRCSALQTFTFHGHGKQMATRKDARSEFQRVPDLLSDMENQPSDEGHMSTLKRLLDIK